MSSLEEQVRNIVFYYIKINYNQYLKKHNLKYIDEDKIRDVIEELYIDKKKDLQNFIRNCLKEMMKNSYPGSLVENIIYEIFEDRYLAINRVTLEISKYQDYMLNNVVMEQEIQIPIDHEYGIGLRLDFLEDEVVIKNFKRTESNQILSAEKTGVISIGDTVTKINNYDLSSLNTQDKIEIVKKAIQGDFINISFKTFKQQNNSNIINPVST